MELIDTHCHLTSFDAERLSQVLINAESRNVKKMLCVGAGMGDDSPGLAVSLANKYSNIWASVGVHPHGAASVANVSHLSRLAADKRVVAIGETGLDFFRDWAPKESQVELFVSSIVLAREYKKPLIIHTRDALEETFAIMEREKAWEVGGVVHCFAGDADFAERLRDINFKVSFPGSITFKKADKLRTVVKQIPLEQIMLETDTPFMAPEPFRGKDSEPMHVYEVAKKIAELRELPIEEIARVTSKNAMELFKFCDYTVSKK